MHLTKHRYVCVCVRDLCVRVPKMGQETDGGDTEGRKRTGPPAFVLPRGMLLVKAAARGG